jgi:hypothetical protein
MVVVETEFSSYEIDDTRIRRVGGKNQPTERQGDDYEWKPFLSISIPTIGERLLVVWNVVDGVVKSTLTSTILNIESKETINAVSR